MTRLPLSDLQQALADPGKYRHGMDHPEKRFFGPSYFNALRDAIFTFHKTGGSLPAAMDYLENRLDAFKNRHRCEEIIDQCGWYVTDFLQRGLVNIQTRLPIHVLLPPWAPPDLICSGHIARIDMVPTGGYAAWLFRAKDPVGWANQLQMPLIQYALAKTVFGAPLSEVSLGIVSFEERLVDYRTYSEEEIRVAQQMLEALLHSLGY
jgi:hypothetical protein